MASSRKSRKPRPSRSAKDAAAEASTAWDKPDLTRSQRLSKWLFSWFLPGD